MADFGTNIDYITLSDTDEHVVGFCHIKPESHFKIHHHTTMELYYILDGSGYLFNRDGWIDASPGRYYLFPAYTNHSCMTQTPGGIKFMYFFIKGPFSTIQYYIDRTFTRNEISQGDDLIHDCQPSLS